MDSRFPAHWLLDYRVQSLSPEAFRLLVNANTWSVSNRSDGDIPRLHLNMIPHAREEHAQELVVAGLWTVTKTGWLITDYATYQTSRAQFDALDHKRRLEAEASRAYRQRQKQRKAASQEVPSYDETHDSQVTESYDDIGKAKARLGNAKEQEIPGKRTLTHSRSTGSSPVEAATPTVTGILALDPDAWPVDDAGLYWRNVCEDSGGCLSAQRLMEVRPDLLTEDQAVNALSMAYPGRQF